MVLCARIIVKLIFLGGGDVSKRFEKKNKNQLTNFAGENLHKRQPTKIYLVAR